MKKFWVDNADFTVSVNAANTVEFKVKRLSDLAVVPQYATELSAGFDLASTADVIIAPGMSVKIPTGLAFELPQGYELQVRPRSGVSMNTKLRISNTPGTVDADYRGEVGILIDNISVPSAILLPYAADLKGKMLPLEEGRSVPVGSYIIKNGDRIAQGVVTAVARIKFNVSDELSETDRGEGGFGHTGVDSE